MTDTYVVINLNTLTSNAKALTEKYSEYGAFIGIKYRDDLFRTLADK